MPGSTDHHQAWRLSSNPNLPLGAEGNLRSPLESGDIVGGARTSGSDDWRRAAALGLIGAFDRALPGLTRSDDPRARIFHALGLWIDGQDAAAEAMLRDAPSSSATTHLRSFLQKDRIKVLAFLPPYRRGPHSIFGSVGSDARFDVQCVYFGARAPGIGNRVGASIHDFYSRERKPDLLICEMVEWHVLPRDLADAPFLKVGHTSDFDIHGQEVLPWLKQFNVVLTLDDSEWTRLRRALPDHPVLNYPKLFPVRIAPAALSVDRPIDLLMTGTVYSDFHHDKNELIARLARIPGLNCVFLNGFVSGPEYAQLTQQSKLTLSYVRHSGTMPTRALESLALGTWPLIQHDSALRLYLNDDAALLPYSHRDLARMSADVARFASAYEENTQDYLDRIGATRALVNKTFAPNRVASQYLRFCAALPAIAAAIDLALPPNALRTSRPLVKRGCVTKGWLPANGDARVMRALLETNVRLAEAADDARGFNEAGRERLIEHARLSSLGSSDARLLERAAEAFETAIRKDPAALAPRFNLVRAGFHFGGAELRTRATELAEDTLKRRDAGELTLSGDDDLLPYDFYPSHFHAQRACDLRLDLTGGDASAVERLETLIVASLHFYLARSMGTSPAADAHYRKALELDPEHVHFRIGHSEYLLVARPQERRHATDALEDIVANKMWTPLSAALTRRASEDNGAEGGGAESDGAEGGASANVVYFDVEDESARDHRYRLARCHDMTGDKYFGTARLHDRAPRLAFVLCGAGVAASPAVGAVLSRLRARVADIEVIVIDTAIDVRAPSTFDADVLLTVPQPGAIAYGSKAIAGALRFVRATYVMIAQPDMLALGDMVDRVLEHVGVSDAVEEAVDGGRPIVVLRDARGRAPMKEILCVGASAELLRQEHLPQQVGILQGARLTLPLLVRQLRPFYKSFLVVDGDARALSTETSAARALDLARFVTPLENIALTTVSADWRLFNIQQASAVPKSRVQLYIAPAEPAVLGPGAPESSLRGGPDIDQAAMRYHLVVEMDRTSLGYRLARKLHQRLSARWPGRMPSAVSDMATSSRRASLSVEHTYAGLKIKLPILRPLAAMFARTARS